MCKRIRVNEYVFVLFLYMFFCSKNVSNIKLYDCSKIFYDNNQQIKQNYNEFIMNL